MHMINIRAAVAIMIMTTTPATPATINGVLVALLEFITGVLGEHSGSSGEEIY